MAVRVVGGLWWVSGGVALVLVLFGRFEVGGGVGGGRETILAAPVGERWVRCTSFGVWGALAVLVAAAVVLVGSSRLE